MGSEFGEEARRQMKSSYENDGMRHRQKANNASCQLLRQADDWDDVAALRLDRRLKLVGPSVATCRACDVVNGQGGTDALP